MPLFRKRRENLPDDPGDIELIEAITNHCESFLGPVEEVLHEVKSPFVHMDLLRFKGDPDDPFHLVVTCGMSSKPMNVPANVMDRDHYRYAELLLCLPSDWPVEWEQLADPANWWPLQKLKILARMPHEAETWVWFGHTFAHTSPPSPFAPDTELCAALVCPNALFPKEFEFLTYKGRTIVFQQLAFLYREEYEYTKANYGKGFLKLVRESGMPPDEFFVLNKHRRNLCKDLS